MARNAEKAMTALARWHRMKEEEAKGPTIKRPSRVEDCHNVEHADKFRRELTREIGKKVTSIQNPGLGEFKIRDLNDDINRLMRLKYKWEDRIKELGGPDYKRLAPKQLDREGREVPGNRGYKYFGAAKDLPGVRELFQPVAQDRTRKTRADLMRHVDADYYGYMDDDDGIIVPLERQAEQQARAAAIETWKLKKQGKTTAQEGTSSKGPATEQEEDEANIYAVPDDKDDDEGPLVVPPALQSTSVDSLGKAIAAAPAAKAETGASTMQVDERGQPTYISQVNVPSQAQIEEALVAKKKADLFAAYCSDVLVEQSNQARVLLGYESGGPANK